MRIVLFFALVSAACCPACCPAWCQAWQPNIVNAQFQTRAYSDNLERQLRADHPTWFGYAVKAASKNSQSCCWNGGGQCGCSLEGDGRSTGVHVSSNSPVPLEGSNALVILVRVSNNTVEKVQAYSPSCTLDAGGLP